MRNFVICELFLIMKIRIDAYIDYLEDDLREQLSIIEFYEDNHDDNKFSWYDIFAIIFIFPIVCIHIVLVPLYILAYFIRFIGCKLTGRPFIFEWPPLGPCKAIDLIDNKIKIEIRHNEHNPPHFHVLINDQDYSFSIERCELLNGSPSSKVIKAINKWHKKNYSKLKKIWNATRPDSSQTKPV